MKEEQCYYVDSDLHGLVAWKPVEDSEPNTLKSGKTNSTGETIFWQNFEVLSDIINENVSISFEIQIH